MVNLTTYAAFKLNQGLGPHSTDENKCHQLYCCMGALVACILKRIDGPYWKLLSVFSVDHASLCDLYFKTSEVS